MFSTIKFVFNLFFILVSGEKIILTGKLKHDNSTEFQSEQHTFPVYSLFINSSKVVGRFGCKLIWVVVSNQSISSTLIYSTNWVSNGAEISHLPTNNTFFCFTIAIFCNALFVNQIIVKDKESK